MSGSPVVWSSQKKQNSIQIKVYFRVSILSTVSGEKTQYNADQAHSKAMSRITVSAQHQDTKLLNSGSTLYLCGHPVLGKQSKLSAWVNAVQT